MIDDSNSPERKPGPLSHLLAWHMSHGPEVGAGSREESHQRLQAMGRESLSFGLRLRDLRQALGWTQRMAAVELGVCVRTVIRYEQGYHRRPGVRTSLLSRLRDLEAACAPELIVSGLWSFVKSFQSFTFALDRFWLMELVRDWA